MFFSNGWKLDVFLFYFVFSVSSMEPTTSQGQDEVIFWLDVENYDKIPESLRKYYLEGNKFHRNLFLFRSHSFYENPLYHS